MTPNGLRFFDAASEREMLLVCETGHPFNNWLCWRHPDGQWVTQRKVTPDDMARLADVLGLSVAKHDPTSDPIVERPNGKAYLFTDELPKKDLAYWRRYTALTKEQRAELRAFADHLAAMKRAKASPI